MNRNRRRVLQAGSALAAVALAGPGMAAGRTPSSRLPDVHIKLRAIRDEVTLRPGKPTAVWRYMGRLIAGDAAALQMEGGTYLGPTIRLSRGQRVRIELSNELPEATTIHWHGLHVPDDMDGHPRHAVAPGGRYIYEFTVLNGAGTYWYHAHPHGRTGSQVYRGLAGVLLVSDDEESTLALPRGGYDLPLVLQDRTFDADQQLVYPASNESNAMMNGGGMHGGAMMSGSAMAGMMARMMGVLGDELLVNGRSSKDLEVLPRAYRLRMVNGANTRTFKLAWSDGSPLTVIGTDGGLLDRPQEREYLMLAPAERIDIWADFGRWDPGALVVLRSLEFDGGMTRGGSRLPDGSGFDVLKFAVLRGDRSAALEPPQRLAHLPDAQPQSATVLAISSGKPRTGGSTLHRGARPQLRLRGTDATLAH